MKKAFLKHESRRPENLIADFQPNYKYLEGTAGGEATSHSALEFMQESFIFNHLTSVSNFKKAAQLKLQDKPE